MYCCEWSTVKQGPNEIRVKPIYCKQWGCEDCYPLRQRQLKAECLGGMPDKMMTLTIRHKSTGRTRTGSRQEPPTVSTLVGEKDRRENGIHRRLRETSVKRISTSASALQGKVYQVAAYPRHLVQTHKVLHSGRKTIEEYKKGSALCDQVRHKRKRCVYRVQTLLEVTGI
jgi:hypothetical protein